MRALDFDMSNPNCWVYRPGSDQGNHGEHKTAHHGHDRVILIGPRAQELIRPYLKPDLTAYLFSPRDATRERNEKRRAARKTPLYPSHLRLQTCKRKKRPRRAPGERYTARAYARAVVLAQFGSYLAYQFAQQGLVVPFRLANELLQALAFAVVQVGDGFDILVVQVRE